MKTPGTVCRNPIHTGQNLCHRCLQPRVSKVTSRAGNRRRSDIPGRLPTGMPKRGIHPEGRPSFISSENRCWKRRKSSRGNPEFRFQFHSSLTVEHSIRRGRRRRNRSPLVRLSEHSACRNHFKRKVVCLKGHNKTRTRTQKHEKNEEDQSLPQIKLQILDNNVLRRL